MIESANPIVLLTVGLIFGVQAVWGFMSGSYLRRDGFSLSVESKFNRPSEFAFVTIVYAVVATVAFGLLIIKWWSTQ